MRGSSRWTRSDRSSALRCPCWRRKTFRMRSRLVERLPPAGRSVERSRRERSTCPLLFDRERLAASARGGRVRVLDGEAAARDRVDEVDLSALQISHADRIDEELDAVRLEHLIAGALPVLLDHQT